MKQLKKSPRQQLEKFSTVFMQLGLVLVLFIVFVSLEYETEQTAILIEKPGEPIGTLYDLDKAPIFVKEVVKKSQPTTQQRQMTQIYEPVVVDNEDDTVVEVVIKPTDDPVDVTVNIKEEDEPEDIDDKEDPTPKSINFISKIPVFKGCENLSEKDGRKCFDKKMNKLVQNHFNTELANELGLRSGKHKIYTQFVIDKTGKVSDIKINAPHSSLKKETNRIIHKIPEFTPGENNGKKVNVKYTLPISFKVE